MQMSPGNFFQSLLELTFLIKDQFTLEKLQIYIYFICYKG